MLSELHKYAPSQSKQEVTVSNSDETTEVTRDSFHPIILSKCVMSNDSKPI